MATPCLPPASFGPIALLSWGRLSRTQSSLTPFGRCVDGWLNKGGWWCCGSAAGAPSQTQFLRAVKRTHSSTQCELVALSLSLSLVVNFHPPPSLVLTDSLNCLQRLRSWDQLPAAKILSCVERMEVRPFLDQWKTHPQPPTLEKIKASDEGGCKAGNLKALGNEQVDALA